jgi:hypothetical protein
MITPTLNPDRFIFFCKAVVETQRLTEIHVDSDPMVASESRRTEAGGGL